ncbi:MAG: diacylglycerol kinase family lipid kinase [Porphyromonadaceae bacterium]|nr:MAG: diacylglycerol kinase family lipid kinase [Porphyromonadaceae bacterium]
MEKISFILHGKIRGKKSVKESLNVRFSADYEVRFYETAYPRHAEKLTDLALSDGCDFLIAVGGDGTLNEMVNGYLKAGGAEKFKTKLGVLPFGTGNDFARGIGIYRNIDQLWDLIELNQPRMLDAGSMQFRLPDGSINLRYFDNIADLGIGGDVVVRVNGVHLRKKILGGKLTFFLSILITFLTYKHKKITVSWEGFKWEGTVLSLVVANGQYFGSGLGIAPEAKLDDGMFEVVIFANLSIMDYLRNYSKLRRAEKIDHPEVFYHRTNQLLVETDGNLIIVEADGEIEGKAPIVYTCLPGALKFLVP